MNALASIGDAAGPGPDCQTEAQTADAQARRAQSAGELF